MKKIVCKSSMGTEIEISKGFPFFLEEITGLNELSGEVAKTKTAFGIGSKYIDTSVNDRAVTITGHFNNERGSKRTFYRDLLYKAFPLKKKGTLFYYEENIARKIDYQVEDIKITDDFAYDAFQIVLYCPSPYLTDVNETKVSLANWKKMFEFPFQIISMIKFGEKTTSLIAKVDNDSNIEIGMRIVLNALGDVVNPSVINITTNEILKLEETLNYGDKIEITTYLNDKNIYVTKKNVTERKNNILVFGSEFLQIQPGKNEFKFDAEYKPENLELEFYYYKTYEAV